MFRPWVRKTNMLDFAADIYKSLHGTEDVSADMQARRAQVIVNLTDLQVKAEKVVNFLSDPALVKQLRSDKSYNLSFLQDSHAIGRALHYLFCQLKLWAARLSPAVAACPRTHRRYPTL